MSCQTIIWALRHRGLSASERVVLMYLADKATAALVCWPSIETICKATELSDKTVRRAVQRLAEMHLIRIEARRRHTHHYHILHPTNGLDGDPLQPEVGDQETVERSELPPNALIPLVPVIQAKAVERSDIPANDRSELPLNSIERSDLPAIVEVDRSFLGGDSPKKEERKEGKKVIAVSRGARLPDDWAPSPGCRAFAEGKGLDPDAVAECFSDYWHAKAGQGACKLDWEATWRNWCRTEVARMPRHRAHAEKPGKLDHLIHSIMAYQPAGHA